MQLSPQQELAFAAVRDWLADPRRQVFRLFGYAGTGKSTIAVHLAADAGHVLFACYTGKAAHVLRQKGARDASTLHSLIYQPSERSREGLRELQRLLGEEKDETVRAELELEIEAEKRRLKQPRFVLNPDSALHEADLLVVDEVSMVGRSLGQDLESFGRPILVLGDPMQLPPVRDGGYWTNHRPDFLLTEIHRQAEDSPVLHLATAVRLGKRLDGPCVARRGSLSMDEIVAHDQILVGTNATRRQVNERLRAHLGHKSPLPEPGDKLVCLRNDHERGLLNGSQWTVVSCEPVSKAVVRLGVAPADGDGPAMEVTSWTAAFLGEESHGWGAKEHQEFDFGYALTVHKAQGSQWDSVLVIDESHVFRADARRWLYTAITRAAKKVTVLR